MAQARQVTRQVCNRSIVLFLTFKNTGYIQMSRQSRLGKVSEPTPGGVGTHCKQTEWTVLELGVPKDSKTPAEAPAKRRTRDWVN